MKTKEIITAVWVCFALGIATGVLIEEKRMHDEAVRHGVGKYERNGNFVWMDGIIYYIR